jgi:hypothetical protein
MLILGADYLIEIKDMLIEYKSRASIGGLNQYEYFLHGQLILTRTISIALWLSQLKSEHFNWGTSNLELRNLGIFQPHIVNMAVMTFLILVLHLWLMIKPNSFNFSLAKTKYD